MDETADQSRDLEALKKEVLIHVGVSLARYQKIERSLKALLPFLVVDGREITDDPFAAMRELMSSKSTLGPLIERLKESMSSSDPEYAARYLETVVLHRNELVHQFFQLPIGRLSDSDGCREALQHLRQRLEYAQPLLDVVNAGLQSLVGAHESVTEQPIHS